MASTRKRTTKEGTPFYEITVSRGRDLPRLTTRWYPPKGWSQRSIDKELRHQEEEFERKVKAGEVVTRKEELAQERQKAAEAAQIAILRIRIHAVYNHKAGREHPFKLPGQS